MVRFSLLIVLFLNFFLACNSMEESNEKPMLNQNGTAKMEQLLQEAHSRIDPMKVNYHLNSVRAENFKLKIENATNLNEQLNARGSYANELLQAGKTSVAIIEVEALLSELEKYKADSKVLRHVKRLQAIAYLRLGEEENCIGNNNEASCILPIQENGIYRLRKGSETAIAIYESILKEDPSDTESIWMLNIAYMTLGLYPDGVPPNWRIPKQAFQGAPYEFPFKNISKQLGFNKTELAGGGSVEDFNNDGFLDILASSWDVNDHICLYINQRDGSFLETTEQTGLKGLTGGLNMVHADYNNDGYIDVLVLRGGWYGGEGRIPNSLLRNNGDGTFSDVTIECGLFSKYPTQTATWNDFNLDGWVDLFIGNESSQQIDAPCELYLNKNGHFTNVINQSGISPIVGVVKGVCSGDVNNDGWPDIYLSVMGRDNLLLLNQGSANTGEIPTFIDVTSKAKVQLPIGGFPTWMWDYNQDGLLDIFAGSYDLANPKVAEETAQYFFDPTINPSKIYIYQNMGNALFEEVSEKLGLVEPAYVMGSNFGDIDNDGFPDFYLGTGAPSFTAVVPNKLYRNKNGKSFEDVTYSARVGHIQKGHAVTFGDFDNDGDQDIFHVVGGAFEGDVFTNTFFENTLDQTNNWVTILLEGKTANRSAIGARIKLTCADDRGTESVFYHTVSTGGSFGSSSLQQEIGIGQARVIKSIEVKWPNALQSTDVFTNIQPNQFLKITEGKKDLEYLERKKFTF